MRWLMDGEVAPVAACTRYDTRHRELRRTGGHSQTHSKGKKTVGWRDRYAQATRHIHTRAAWGAMDCSGRRTARTHLGDIMQGPSIGRPGIVALDRGKARAHTGGRAARG